MTHEDLLQRIREFDSERDWNRFHTPKNLSMALMIETGELAEIFQWMTGEESAELPPEKLRQAREEIGDVVIYLLNLADKLGVDPMEAALEKLSKNAEKYPAEKARGKALKYRDLE
ncbi:MAG: nucleotide pyrophosphohydrolase [Candidatus Fermentibacterota bacterium]